jgi:hypothetical protein
MPPLSYHAGQLSIQAEAKTTVVAEKLAGWVGPVAEFAKEADIVLLTTRDDESVLRFSVLSGAPPLLQVAGDASLRLRFPPALTGRLAPGRYGGLVISLATARRARLNGVLAARGDSVELTASETFTLCRKYVVPSLAIEDTFAFGPAERSPLSIDDPWLAGVIERAETSFLASVSPDGGPDIAHRGGPPGFLALDVVRRTLSWPEYVGDGVFKSAGNVRATGSFTLLVPDLDSGDGVEIVGIGRYTNTRPERRRRLDPLVQHREPFPVQGTIDGQVVAAQRLRGVLRPRRRLEKALRVTSCSTVDEQAPQ